MTASAAAAAAAAVLWLFSVNALEAESLKVKRNVVRYP